MSSNRKSGVNNLAVQGGILAITSLLVRLIGFFYRIPLYRQLGTEGVGYYAGAFQIYAYILVISSYGFPSALAKIISKKHAQKRYREAHQIFRSALLLGLLIGLITASIMYFGAGPLSRVIKQEGSFYSFRALAPSLLLFSLLAVFRGYFQGHNTMVPTALSQVVEQIFNAAFSLGFAILFLKTSIEMGAAGGTLGTSFGVAAGLIVVVVIYLMARPTFNRRIRKDTISTESYGVLSGWKVIYATAIPILIGASVYNMSNLMDTLFFQRGLQLHGHNAVFAAEMYGTMSSYMLLLTLPISIASALAAASIPSITASVARQDEGMVVKKATMALKTVLIICIPAAFGLAMMAGPIIYLVYAGGDNLPLTARLLQIGAVSVIFFGISGIITGILQGLGKLYIPVRNSAIGIGFKLIAYGIFVYLMDTGLYGAVVINVVFSFIVALANIYALRKSLAIKMKLWKDIGAPTLASLLMGVVAVVVYTVVMSLTANLGLSTLIGIVFAGLVYFVLLLGFGGIDEQGLKVLPMGPRLITISKKLKLLR